MLYVHQVHVKSWQLKQSCLLNQMRKPLASFASFAVRKIHPPGLMHIKGG